MTETELKQTLEMIESQRLERLVPPTNTRGRAQRRHTTAQKKAALYALVSAYYIPHAGYVAYSVDGDALPYVRHMKNSHCQRWIKRHSSHLVRKYPHLSPKGQLYRRVFDYWWTLY